MGTAQRLDALLGELKDFARGQVLDLQDVDIGAMLRAALEFWQPEAEVRGIALQFEGTASDVTLRADAEKLTRVFDNLLKNSIDAIDEGPGSIVVRVESIPTGRVRLRFSDSGPGLPPGVDVFALFETTKPKGTGLGLPICRQILDAHGGDISVVSTDSGGTVFQVDLPRHGPPLA